MSPRNTGKAAQRNGVSGATDSQAAPRHDTATQSRAKNERVLEPSSCRHDAPDRDCHTTTEPRPMKTLLLRGKRCVRGRKFTQSRRFFADLIISISGEGSGIDHMIWRCRECRTKTNVLGHHMHVCVESISLEHHNTASKQRNFLGIRSDAI